MVLHTKENYKEKKNSLLYNQFKIFENFTIDKIIVSKKNKRWVIYLKSSKYLNYEEINDLIINIKKSLKISFDIDIKMSCPTCNDILKDNFTMIWIDIKNYILKDMPSANGWFEFVDASFDLHMINLSITHPIAYDFFKSKFIDEYIHEWIKTTFDISIKVDLKLEYDPINNEPANYLEKREAKNAKLSINSLEHIDGNSFSKKSKDSNLVVKNTMIFGKESKGNPTPIKDINGEMNKVLIEGSIISYESREIKGGKYIFTIDVTDYTSSITTKVFCDKEKFKILNDNIQKNMWVKVSGECLYDKYQKEYVVYINSMSKIDDRKRLDTCDSKRVELHLHTQMSSMDAVSSVESLVKRAAEWGHPAVAITDHGVIQAFPDAYAAGKKHDIKILYGVEAYLVNDCNPIITGQPSGTFEQPFVIFDIETTGLDNRKDKIIEIGAVKYKNKSICETFQMYVNPEINIPSHITDLTGITNDMVNSAPLIDAVLKEFKSFCDNSVMVAHNAPFDIGFIRNAGKPFNINFENPVLDTLLLSRELLKDLKKHKLNIIADYLGITIEKHHSALSDAKTTGEIFLYLLGLLENQGIEQLTDINRVFNHITNINNLEAYHGVILVKNYIGLKNLYKLISLSHLNYYYRKPRIPYSILANHREGLIIGSGCEAGELYRALVKGLPDEAINDIVSFYDYLEIQPVGNNEYLIREGILPNTQSIQEINKKIVDLAIKHNKPVIATGDVHFLDPHDEYFRRILMSGQGFNDADLQAPLYFKTTLEMLDEFSYLGKDLAEEVVIKAPLKIANSIEDIKPVPDDLHTPEIPGAEDDIKTMALENAYNIYGNPLPDIVNERLNKELSSIINNGFAVLYLIAHKLVAKSLSDGYLVGSRGSVGSSFVATMTGITEVNPLPPHYVCNRCKFSDFDIDTSLYGCGADLPQKNCPVCNSELDRDGFDIPFEVFMGFKGDKVPDIDLNFSGDYQSSAHKYTEELFGEGHVFRAGTIGTIAEKTAFGFVKKYIDEKGYILSNAEVKRLVNGCTGVKRTTGQHPGGVMVIPKKYDVYDFTPIQHPADDKKSGVVTTHFDYHSIHDNLVKLDILGHDDPTMIRMLEDLTGVDARTIPLGEEKTMGIFSDTQPLGLKSEDINSPVGTFGIPEFGTKFVRQMLVDTKPKTFSELIRISGLSHGTDVWLNNAQDLVKNGTAKLSEVISTRDDIMVYLIYMGMEPTTAFQIMESVRKGKGLNEDFERKMKECNVPDWFIESCKKIKYMFPKAHAAAYVIMAFRIAYFKVYYPKEFYAAYFTVRADDFDADYVMGGAEIIQSKIKELEQKGNTMSTKEKNLLTIIELALEMYKRGISFLPVDLYLSDAKKFIVTNEGIRPPLNALQGVGDNAAKSIINARSMGKFISVEDMCEKCKITKNVVEILKKHGVLDGIPDTSQISLF